MITVKWVSKENIKKQQNIESPKIAKDKFKITNLAYGVATRADSVIHPTINMSGLCCCISPKPLKTGRLDSGGYGKFTSKS